MKPFAIVVAFDARYGIGKGGGLPWHLPSDLKHFKDITTAVSGPAKHNAVIMGRKTWESLPAAFRPLPGRVNLVLSKQGLELASGVRHAAGLDEALEQSVALGIENIFVIGGAQVFGQALQNPHCQKLYVTHIQGDYGCDVFFPPISRQFFPVSASEEQVQGGIHFHFCEYLRS